jgi:enamine deaminase RidA (YjgF/YER057c/UK114 family)
MKILNPEGIYNSPKYYSGLAAGDLVFLAGRVAKHPDGSVFAPGDAARQTEQIMSSIGVILAEGGAAYTDIVNVQTYYVDDSDWPQIHDVRQKAMGDHYPPHTATRVETLGSPDIRVEIEVTAVVETSTAGQPVEGGKTKMKVLNPDGIYHSPRYYSGVRVGNIIYTAGRVPLDLEGQVVAPDDARAQTAKIMEDLRLILKEGRATLQDVTYVHTYFQYTEDMAVIHEIRQRAMGDHYPPHTGTKVDKPSWVERGIRVEIEVIAVVE